MSEDKKEDLPEPTSFASKVKPSEAKIKELEDKSIAVKQETVDNSVVQAQNNVVTGLTDVMTEFQINNMKSLAPRDEFEIPQGSGKIWKRRKMKPSMIRELRKAERIYNQDVKQIEDPDLKLDRDWQLLAFKANLYFGMTNEEFEDTDVEYLQTVIQATELRTQGFRQY